ncbi:SGS-domain-containing protein [Obba rivulosa]|uniref:SGS-domain-containing protein n=1 Tax=Obba rivulosa TaxID=1052685 RepID=A0A8E2J842_9APHY|nr:SGS-domain-containing protein [Obba rivulosa]
MTALRHEFYETDERLTLSVFDKGADPEQVSVTFEPRGLIYQNGDKKLELTPLKGQIDPEKSDYTVGKVKVEIRLAKMAQGRWGSLVGDSPDPLTSFPTTSSAAPSAAPRKSHKNWDGITNEILGSDKSPSSSDDPNAGGDAAVNEFFQKLYADADEDTRRAMLKSYQESGGTTLSTNWEEVGKSKVDVKPPEGSEWKKWAA